MKPWRNITVILVCLGLAVFAGALGNRVSPVITITQGYESEELHHLSHTMPMTLLGQFRTNLNAYLWLKTVDYLHNGIAYRPYSTKERAEGMQEHTHDIGGYAKHQCGGPTLIPAKEEDWRAVFGDLERNIQPYRPGPARHSDPQELIPWYRVQTIINPHDVNAYATCAFFLGDFARRPERALDVLKSGIENNPDSPVLHQATGQLYFEKWNDYDSAIPYLQKAIVLGNDVEAPDEKQEKALEDAYLFSARAFREKGDLEAAIETARQGMQRCPESALIRAIYRICNKELEQNSGPI